MIDNDARLRELSSKALEGTMADEEFIELAQLSKAKQKMREDRAAQIVSLKQSMQNLSVTIHELFSIGEINTALINTRKINLQQKLLTKSIKRERVPGEKVWARQKSGLVLVEVRLDGNNGLPSRYCKGDALDAAYVSKNFKMLDDGQLENNLVPYYTEEGKQYFSTEEGKMELDRLIKYIKKRKMKPTYR